MSDSPVNLSAGLPETVLPDVDPALAARLAAAVDAAEPREAIAEVVASDPLYLEAWARLSEAARDDVESYAYARVGYHRGLDALRKSGWKGSGYVRWSSTSNRGFLRSLENLRKSAEAIGESAEAERCAMFLRQCDPEWKGLPPE